MAPEVDKSVIQKVNISVKLKDLFKITSFTWLGDVQVVLANDPEPQNFICEST